MSRIKAEFGVFKISKTISQGQGSEGRFNQDPKVLLFGAARTHICVAVVLVFVNSKYKMRIASAFGGTFQVPVN